MKLSFLFASVLLFAALREASADETLKILVVVNKGNTVSNLSSAALARIYKGRQDKWPDGTDIVVIDRPVRSKLRAGFYNAILRTTPTRKFFGPGSPIPFRPIIIRSDDSVRAFVSRVPGAIGYLEETGNGEQTKELTVDGKHNNDPSYLLRVEVAE